MIKKRLKQIIFFLVLVSMGLFAKAQPFAKEIAAFKNQDSLSFPGKGKILFVGSSSFTFWKDVQQYFPEYPIINRGFGGSSLTDLIRYAPDVIFPYEPKQIVIYCGENDFAGDTSLYPSQVAQRFFDLFNLIRARYKKVPIAYISMKPSPSRQHLMARFNVANVMIKNFLKKKKRTAYIDVYKAMLKENGLPKDEIFLADKLHMNAEGYKIWKKIIEPHLLKD